MREMLQQAEAGGEVSAMLRGSMLAEASSRDGAGATRGDVPAAWGHAAWGHAGRMGSHNRRGACRDAWDMNKCGCHGDTALWRGDAQRICEYPLRSLPRSLTQFFSSPSLAPHGAPVGQANVWGSAHASPVLMTDDGYQGYGGAYGVGGPPAGANGAGCVARAAMQRQHLAGHVHMHGRCVVATCVSRLLPQTRRAVRPASAVVRVP